MAAARRLAWGTRAAVALLVAADLAAGLTAITTSNINYAVYMWINSRSWAESEYGHISEWDTSQVTDMARLFQDSIFNDDISAWDTSAATSMFATFQNAKQFNQPLNDWEVSGVTSMVSMFAHAESFNQPLDSWDVSQVASLDSMFYYAYALDQDLSWCIDASVVFNSDSLQGTSCVVPKCGIGQKDANGVCIYQTRPPTPAPTPVQTSAAGAVTARYWTLVGVLAGAAVLLL